MLAHASVLARVLLHSPGRLLHGDPDHHNALDGGERCERLAIDGQGLMGELGFDFANVCCNPDPEAGITLGRL